MSTDQPTWRDRDLARAASPDVTGRSSGQSERLVVVPALRGEWQPRQPLVPLLPVARGGRPRRRVVGAILARPALLLLRRLVARVCRGLRLGGCFEQSLHSTISGASRRATGRGARPPLRQQGQVPRKRSRRARASVASASWPPRSVGANRRRVWAGFPIWRSCDPHRHRRSWRFQRLKLIRLRLSRRCGQTHVHGCDRHANWSIQSTWP